ncbi:hypothetical protein B0T25DRAFT_175599 [Lasiosphaeria hispida]|uniref:Uncharacterized protein n=1 Tax=Lasiosphaeria hispida TaxID=260671 RepID=A0AAJ0HNI8_9PEZI|nr:hypothetical protein B0T25DRAFT_175599 [Lasiosphaeria hispida]
MLSPAPARFIDLYRHSTHRVCFNPVPRGFCANLCCRKGNRPCREMTMNTLAEWPSQFGPEQPAEVFFLTGQRQLSFYRHNNSNRVFRVVESAPSETNRNRLFINLDSDAVLLLYAISGEPRTSYDIQVEYFEGKMPVLYSFRDRTEAFRFQRLVTGFRAVESFSRVGCSVVFRGRLGVFGRDSEREGRGEVQFWRTTATAPEPSSLPPMGPSTRSLPQSLAAPSTSYQIERRSSVITVQSDRSGDRELVISAAPPKPILMAFIQSSSRYTMLRIDVTDLVCKHVSGNWIELSSANRSFVIESLSVEKSKRQLWNVCAMGRGAENKDEGIELLKCTNLSLELQGPQQIADFEKRMLYLKAQWLKSEQQRTVTLSAMSSGKVPATAVSPNSATSPVSFLSIPSAAATRPGEYFELATEPPTQELDSISLNNIAELDGNGVDIDGCDDWSSIPFVPRTSWEPILVSQPTFTLPEANFTPMQEDDRIGGTRRRWGFLERLRPSVDRPR